MVTEYGCAVVQSATSEQSRHWPTHNKIRTHTHTQQQRLTRQYEQHSLRVQRSNPSASHYHWRHPWNRYLSLRTRCILHTSFSIASSSHYAINRAEEVEGWRGIWPKFYVPDRRKKDWKTFWYPSFSTHFIYLTTSSSSVEYICWQFLWFDFFCWHSNLISFVFSTLQNWFLLISYIGALRCLHSYLISPNRNNETSALNYMLQNTMYKLTCKQTDR